MPTTADGRAGRARSFTLAARARTMMRGAPLAMAVAAWLAGVEGGLDLAAQQSVRDGAAVPQRLLQGQVRLASESAAVLRRVRITLAGSTAPPAFTDQEGRFELLVPERAWALRISKPGFAPQVMQGSGTEPASPLDVRLVRGAAINGRVIDGSGMPVVDARITVRQARDAGRRGQVPITVTVRSDDLGEFRVGSLPAGRYALEVDGNSRQTGLGSPQVTRIVPPSASADVDPEPAAAEPAGTGTLPPSAVLVRTAEEASVVVTFDRRDADFRAAAEYAASAEASTAQATAGIARWSLVGGRGGGLALRGTGAVAGRVTDHNGRPVAGAIVRLDPVSPSAPRTAASDGTGRYVFSGVAAGAYRVSALKTGFIEGEYGQQRVGQPGVIVRVADRLRSERIDIGLRRGAAISGSVMDPDGEPLEGVAMHAWRLEYRNGLPVTQSAGVVSRSDDRGRYRLHSLPPGTYFVVAADDPTASDNAAAVTRAPKAFYPGTPSVAQATPLYVDVGLDAAGVDMVFTPSRTVRVSGRASDAGDNPLNRAVVLVASTHSGFPAPAPQVALMRGWEFEFPNVAPGEYMIQAVQYWGDVPGAEASTEFVVQPLTVGEQDVPNVRVRTTPGSTVSGRIVMENGSRAQVGGTWLTVAAADPDYEPAAVLPRPWTIALNPDLSFRMMGLWGPLRVTSRETLPPSVWLKTANLTGLNIADGSALFGRRNEPSLDVVLAEDGAVVSGRVVNARKEPVGQYVVAVLPTASELRYVGSRYVRLARPDERGEFQAGMLPPGDYVVAAVDALADAALHDPEVVRHLLEAGRRVTLDPAERLTADVPLMRLNR